MIRNIWLSESDWGVFYWFGQLDSDAKPRLMWSYDETRFGEEAVDDLQATYAAFGLEGDYDPEGESKFSYPCWVPIQSDRDWAYRASESGPVGFLEAVGGAWNAVAYPDERTFGSFEDAKAFVEQAINEKDAREARFRKSLTGQIPPAFRVMMTNKQEG